MPKYNAIYRRLKNKEFVKLYDRISHWDGIQKDKLDSMDSSLGCRAGMFEYEYKFWRKNGVEVIGHNYRKTFIINGNEPPLF